MVRAGWKEVNIFPVLGHQIANDYGTDECFASVKVQIWKAARMNITNLIEIVYDRLKQVDRLLTPIVTYRWSRWPYHEKRARQLDKLQRDLINMCMRKKKRKDQTKDEFHLQVMQQAS